MLADPEAIRAVAREVRGLAAAVEDEQGSLTQAGAITWRSPSGAAFRAELDDWSRQVGGTLTDLAEAAHALERHADEVEHVQGLIRAAEQWVRSGVAQARDTVEGFVDGVVDAVTHTVSDAVRGARELLDRVPVHLPPAGDLGWLDLRERLGGGR